MIIIKEIKENIFHSICFIQCPWIMSSWRWQTQGFWHTFISVCQTEILQTTKRSLMIRTMRIIDKYYNRLGNQKLNIIWTKMGNSNTKVSWFKTWPIIKIYCGDESRLWRQKIWMNSLELRLCWFIFTTHDVEKQISTWILMTFRDWRKFATVEHFNDSMDEKSRLKSSGSHSH